jgi:hypothetical protein
MGQQRRETGNGDDRTAAFNQSIAMTQEQGHWGRSNRSNRSNRRQGGNGATATIDRVDVDVGRGRGHGRLLFRVLFETLVNAKWRCGLKE